MTAHYAHQKPANMASFLKFRKMCRQVGQLFPNQKFTALTSFLDVSKNLDFKLLRLNKGVEGGSLQKLRQFQPESVCGLAPTNCWFEHNFPSTHQFDF